VALVVAGVPLDALVEELGPSRGAIYKTMFDARRKLRAALGRKRISGSRHREAPMNVRSELERFLQTDPRDVGCGQAMEMLHVYVDLIAQDAAAAQRYPGIAAHLRACGPCSEDFRGLLAAVTDPVNGAVEHR
jgi:hypothetical protein